MAFSIPFKKIGKWALVLSFIAVISWVGYLVFDELFYHGRVKVTVIDKHTNKPITLTNITFKELECSPQPCEPKVLAVGKTNLFGNLRINTKEIDESFQVIVQGYHNDGPWTKRPGSLLFSRVYGERDFYSANLSQTDLQLLLEPNQ